MFVVAGITPNKFRLSHGAGQITTHPNSRADPHPLNDCLIQLAQFTIWNFLNSAGCHWKHQLWWLRIFMWNPKKWRFCHQKSWYCLTFFSNFSKKFPFHPGWSASDFKNR